jgi:diadenosine tetraphosphatase ApaH/serine/threonine PP2A family protein phosphatase
MGTCPRSRPCSRKSTRTQSSAAATWRWGGLPAETLARIRDVGADFVRGNCDRDPGDWVREQLSSEQLEFLADLPLTVELDVDGLGRVLFFHATPTSDEQIFTRLTPDDELAAMLEGVEADVLVCGHTHVQFDRNVDRCGS